MSSGLTEGVRRGESNPMILDHENRIVAVEGVTVTPGGSSATGKAYAIDGAANLLYDYPFTGQFYHFRPTGAIAETFPRLLATTAVNLSGGFIQMQAIGLPINTTVTSISFMTGVTAGSGLTHQWFGIADSSRVIQQVTSDDTSTAWGANTVKTLTLASPFVTTYSGLHYLTICVTASTTVPNLVSLPEYSNATLITNAPRLVGATNSGQTTPVTVPFSAAGFSGGSTSYSYAYVS